MTIKVGTAAAFLICAISACSSEAPWPAESWPTSTAAAQGIDQSVIDEIVTDIREGEYGLVDHFLLIRNGHVVADYKFEQNYDSPGLTESESAIHNADRPGYQYNYVDTSWHPFYRDTKLHTMQSVTKSVMSAAFGVAIDQGLIDGVDVPAMQYFDDYSHDMSDPRKQAMTVRDLMTMQSGISWVTEGGYDSEEHSTGLLENSQTWIQFILDRPMDADPGTVYEYNDGASVLLGKIIGEATGMRADKWAEQQLFAPIGIDDYYWKITPDGEADTEGGLYLTTHDLARIGYLFLRNGEWNGNQVLSADWVSQSTTFLTGVGAPDDENPTRGYGYQWWIHRDENTDAYYYMGNGYGGQFLVVYPKYDLVAVFNGWNIRPGDYRWTMSIVEERIVPALD